MHCVNSLYLHKFAALLNVLSAYLQSVYLFVCLSPSVDLFIFHFLASISLFHGEHGPPSVQYPRPHSCDVSGCKLLTN